ncbi:MAG: spore cortex biosynthesis protein YabQ [Clostridia bacterium]|nr:spore cortex biosynthesis protein YabQ [Clostridia bacterium]
MTDYLYGLSLATQTKNFLLSLGFGFIMGILYDLFRIVKISISKGKLATIISDILYCIFLCFALFLFCLTVNEGEIRLYLLLGSMAGFFVYYFSLGVIIFSFSEKIIAFIKAIIKSVFNIISYPFRFIFGKMRKIFNNLWAKSRKNTKNIKNKSKFLLKVNKRLLYNLFVKK